MSYRRVWALSISPAVISLAVAMGCAVWGLTVLPVSWHTLPQSLLRPAGTSTSTGHHTPPVITTPSVAQPLRIPRPDCAHVPCIALTFDDGPNAVTTPQILDILDREQVHATFFVVGSRIANQGHLLRRMHAAGHEIGSHSWSHPDLTTMPVDQIMRQVNLTQAAIIREGIPAPSLFRPPYGAINPTVRNAIPMTLALWNIDPLDWETKDAHKVRDAIVAHARPGSVVDLHDIYPVTVESLAPTIQALRGQYQFVTFSELFNLDSGQRGEYFGR